MGIKDSRRAPKLDPDIKVVCAKIVETLNMIGSARLHRLASPLYASPDSLPTFYSNSKSMASLYAARIQTLLDHLDERPSPAQSTSPPNNFDAGFSVTGGIDFDAWCRDNLNSGANEFFSFPVMGELDDMAWFDGGLGRFSLPMLFVAQNTYTRLPGRWWAVALSYFYNVHFFWTSREESACRTLLL